MSDSLNPPPVAYPLDLIKGEYTLFREIMEGHGDIVFVKDVQGCYISVNQAFCDTTGRTKAEILGKSDPEVLGRLAAVEPMAHDRRLLADGRPVQYDYVFKRGSETTHFRTKKFLLRDRSGVPVAIIGVSRDVTGTKLAESKYRFIFDNAPIAFWEEDFSQVKVILDELKGKGVVDFRSHFQSTPQDLERCIDAIRIVDVNLATMRMNRTMNKPQVIADLKRKFTNDSHAIFIDEFTALAEGRTFYQSEASTVEVGDDRLDVLFNLNVLPGHEQDLSLVLVSIVDVTPLKRTETELSRIQELYRSVVEGQREMICRFGPDRTVSFFNASFGKFFQKKADDLGRFLFSDLFPDSDNNNCSQRLSALSPTDPSCSVQTHNYDQNGNMVWQEWSMTALFGPEGLVREYQAVGVDITLRKETDDSLAASEARWRSVFENAEDMILTLNAHGLILSANPSASESAGMRLAGKAIDDVLPSETESRVHSMLNQVFHGGERLDIELKMKAGPLRGRILNCVFTPIFHGGKVIFATLIARDITKHRKLENQVREALIEGQENERKRVSRELHDGLGQLFTAIKLNLQHLSSGLGEDLRGDVLERFSQLERNIGVAIEEVKHISHNLMPDILEQYGLQPALRELVKSWNSNNGGVQVTLETTGQERKLQNQTALSLFRMAQELITNSVRHGAPTTIFVQLIDHGDTMMLIVEDDGIGFDTERESQGLGLRNIRSRADLLEGTVDIDSRPGKGTVTTVEIPV